MRHLENHMKMLADQIASQVGTCYFGLVSSYDPKTFRVKVKRQPEDPENPQASESNWMPIGSLQSGNGFGITCAPNIGDAVIVFHIEGHYDAQVAGLFYFNDEDRPANTKAGEILITHKGGSTIKLTDDGKLLINGVTEIDITAPMVKITGTVSIEGDLSVTGKIAAGGDITDLNNASGSLQDIRGRFNVHIHEDPQGGQTSPPNNPFET